MSAAHPLRDRRAAMLEDLQRNVPHELREYSAWLLFRLEPKEGRPGEWDKVPYYANGNKRRGAQGSPEDAEHLADFAAAMQTLTAPRGASFDGVGLALLPCHPVTALDLDKLAGDPERRELAGTVLASGTYVETSPSGNGQRAFFAGKVGFGNVKNHAAGVEVFESSGFVTVTGAELSDGAGLEPMPDTLHARLAVILSKPKNRPAPQERPALGKFDLNRLPLELAPRIVAGFPSGVKDRSAFLYWRALDLRQAGLSECEALEVLGDPDLPWIAPALERRGGDIESARDWLWKYTVQPVYAQPPEKDGQAGSSGASQKWLEPQPLPPELHPVQPFDLELLPDSLRPWIADVCERVQCPPDFVAVPVMVALGSLIGRKVRIRPKACDSWSVVANVWGCIIGRPGTMKSPAVSEALQPLRRLEAQARDEYEAARGEYEAQAELAALHKEAAKKRARDKISSGKGEVTADALRVDMPDAPTHRRTDASALHRAPIERAGAWRAAAPESKRLAGGTR